MDTSLTDSREWAVAQFGSVNLGDLRRNRRLVGVAESLARSPQGTLPGSFDSWAELKAAYRLLGQKDVTYEKIIAPHQDQVRQQCRQSAESFLVEDKSDLDFSSHRSTQGLGLIGNGWGRGIMLHTTLALRVERWEDNEPVVSVMGLFAQKPWVRDHPPRRKHEKKKARLQRRRESQDWAAALREVPPPPDGARQTYIADRESDVYEVFQEFQAHPQRDYIVRACWPRALDDQAGSVFAAVAAAPVLGQYSLDLRARPGVKARTAMVELRSCTVTLRAPWRPGGKGAPCRTNVVEAREVDPPPGVEPLHWVLLTSWPVETFEEALRVVRAYSCRWLIEEYHKALKTGVGMERSELSTCQGILSLLGILAVVAVRLLDLKFQAVTAGEALPDPDCVPPEALTILEAKYGRPAGGWTNTKVLVAIARMGGFLARKSDGNPGWLTLWRGMRILLPMLEGFMLGQGEKCG